MLSYYQQRRRDLINITSYIITIRFYICALSSSIEQSTLRVFLTYSPRSNTTPSITLLSFEFTTGNSEDPEIKIEYDESIVYDPQAQYIGRIQYVPPNRMVNRAYFGKNLKIELLADLPREYQSYKSLFLPSTAAKLPPRRTFDHAIDLVEGAEPPFGPIYPLSGKQLDLKDGYHLIRIKKGDEWKIAFQTRYGLYQYNVMPFGLVNAPATFQDMMNQVLREFLDQGVVVYLDDILIYSRTQKEHTELVRRVLHRLREYQLAVSLPKSVFNTKSVEFLGYIVTTEGVTTSERKGSSIKEWKAPQSVKEVQIFIGFANFYRRFIRNFSGICAPITETLKGDPKGFNWGPAQNKAFEELKTHFTTAPILIHFNPLSDTVVETDASYYSLGYVLSQYVDKKLHPVAFHSRKFSPTE